ncbi:MAG: tRNA (adenosine(37)-N6)-threonylcarbamoyltransferase complex ATPase subunit type 1 TsaE [Thermodesulfobacteriota bacterium]|nr:tRNA (adenosine(37)-N6)-threonylcarbamoyltransferase complex ATPase subunit type 1 TsaE [Thermodesulfobacteriota bacterium]
MIAFSVHLKDTQATLDLGQSMAEALLKTSPYQNILLLGELGAGKTTLARGLLRALPGGDKALVSSPSFNILNLYPTEPETAHFDFYRLENQAPDESLLEILHAGERVVLVEWPDFLGPLFWPENFVLVKWQPGWTDKAVREVEISAGGDTALAYLRVLRTGLIKKGRFS